MAQSSSSKTRREPAQESFKPKLSAEDRLTNLENCVAKMATLSGNGNHLKEFGLDRWIPGKDDMKKYRG